MFSAGSTLSERPPGQLRLQNQNDGFRFRADIPLTSVQGLGPAGTLCANVLMSGEQQYSLQVGVSFLGSAGGCGQQLALGLRLLGGRLQGEQGSPHQGGSVCFDPAWALGTEEPDLQVGGCSPWLVGSVASRAGPSCLVLGMGGRVTISKGHRAPMSLPS